MQFDPLSQSCHDLGWQRHATDPVEYLYCLVVSVYMEGTFVLSGLHKLRNDTHYPYRSKYMIGMRMGEEHGMNVGQRYACFFKLYQYSVSSSRVYQQCLILTSQGKAGIIASGNRRIAGPQHDKFCCFVRFHKFFFE